MSFNQSVLLPVSPDEAFALVTEPERIRRWLAVSAYIDLRAGGDERSDAALHVDRAAAVELPTAQLGLERVRGPAFAGRDDVEMAGKAEMGRSAAAGAAGDAAVRTRDRAIALSMRTSDPQGANGQKSGSGGCLH